MTGDAGRVCNTQAELRRRKQTDGSHIRSLFHQCFSGTRGSTEEMSPYQTETEECVKSRRSGVTFSIRVRRSSQHTYTRLTGCVKAEPSLKICFAVPCSPYKQRHKRFWRTECATAINTACRSSLQMACRGFTINLKQINNYTAELLPLYIFINIYVFIKDGHRTAAREQHVLHVK